MKIVVLDGYAANPGDLSWEELKQLGDLTIYDRTPQKLVVERSLEAEAVLVNKVSLTRELIMQLPKLKYIGELATGYNNIDLVAARERGVIVTNIPAYSTVSVAQHVIALLLNVTNHVDEFARKNRNGRWSASPDFCYWDEPLCELSGKTMGDQPPLPAGQGRSQGHLPPHQCRDTPHDEVRSHSDQHGPRPASGRACCG